MNFDPKAPYVNQASTTRRAVLGGLIGSPFLTSCVGGVRAEGTMQPNIIFIMADDLGYADLSCYGRRDFQTPNLDRLASEGIKFTSSYSNSPVCSPTRMALMTGRYQYRLPGGLEEPLGLRDLGLGPEERTLPGELKKLGYQTALIGKWHLGLLPTYSPLKSGYDHFYGFRNGGVDYFTHSVLGQKDLWDGDVPAEENGYLTELLGDRAISQIELFNKDESPFFLSLHFSASHWPWQANDELGRAESERLGADPNPFAILHYDGGTLETYAGMVQSLDQQVGRVMKKLKQLKIDRNTIIVFASDNGGERFSDNWPFMGRKGVVLEGGIRIPTIFRWPEKVKKGVEDDTPIITMDWVPTLLSAAGSQSISAMQPDGVDLSDLILGENLQLRSLFWRYNLHNQKAVRRGRWKYLEIAGNDFLFDLVADPMERANLKNRNQDIFDALKAEYHVWNQQMLPYSKTNSSLGESGAQSADRYGVLKSNTVDIKFTR